MGRIDRLLAAMTLEEKIGQLNMAAGSRVVTGPGAPRDVEEGIRSGRIGSVLNVWGSKEVHALQCLAVEHSRLGTPLLVALDVIHGHRTVFPVPLAEAGLFDSDAWERTARVAAEEAGADGVALTFAPMVDVARDPRWGRMVESPGEDPWVAAEFAAAKVRGFQGRELLEASGIAATAKHLCAYAAVTAGREYASVDVSERTLHEVHLPPFAAAVSAGTAAIMPAFIDIAGVPMTANAPLLQGWLRGLHAFDGVLISDYNAVAELCSHGVASDTAAAAALALKAGIDIDMASEAYVRGLPEALRRGLIGVGAIDAAVSRVLRLKERLGLFEDPYRRGAARRVSGRHRASARQLAREVARRAVVLLTHRHHVLPLPPTTRHIAVIGRLGSTGAEMLGPWPSAGRAEEAVTIIEGLRQALPQCRIDHFVGAGTDGGHGQAVSAAVEGCRAAELLILCLGEDVSMSGEGGSRATLGLPEGQQSLTEALLELGKPVVVLLMSGRPLTVPWLFERADAVLATWFLGSEAGNAIADVLTGTFNPTGKLAVTWPRHVGQVPIFYGQRPPGRPASPGERLTSSYLDSPVTPQFAFGHGLSYASFTLDELHCTPAVASAHDSIEVTVSVRNNTAVAGEATVFLFVRDVVASIARPVLELKGVRRIALAPGERDTLRWRLPVATLSFVGAEMQPVLEPGRFEIHVGHSADPDELIRCELEVTA